MMWRPIPIIVGVVAALLAGTGVGVALVRSGNDGPATPATSTTTMTIAVTTTAAAPVTTTKPATTVARATTTRVTSPAPTTPSVTTVATTTTTKPVLTRAAATQSLCKEIEAAVRQVADGSTIAGGLRLVRAINTYGDTADPAVVSPARRMASTGLSGDLDASAAATQEAGAACQRLGFRITLPGTVECITTPCP